MTRRSASKNSVVAFRQISSVVVNPELRWSVPVTTESMPTIGLRLFLKDLRRFGTVRSQDANILLFARVQTSAKSEA